MTDEDSSWSRVNGIDYHYEHISEDEIPDGDKTFEVKSVIRYTNRPIHLDTYYVPQERLDEFLRMSSETGEEIVDIRVKD